MSDCAVYVNGETHAVPRVVAERMDKLQDQVMELRKICFQAIQESEDPKCKALLTSQTFKKMIAIMEATNDHTPP